jgi:hypothetical protein
MITGERAKAKIIPSDTNELPILYQVPFSDLGIHSPYNVF